MLQLEYLKGRKLRGFRGFWHKNREIKFPRNLKKSLIREIKFPRKPLPLSAKFSSLKVYQNNLVERIITI